MKYNSFQRARANESRNGKNSGNRFKLYLQRGAANKRPHELRNATSVQTSIIAIYGPPLHFSSDSPRYRALTTCSTPAIHILLLSEYRVTLRALQLPEKRRLETNCNIISSRQ